MSSEPGRRDGPAAPDAWTVGPDLPEWTPRRWPERSVAIGRYCRLEPLDGRHADALSGANELDVAGLGWTYLPYGPFPDRAAYRRWVERMADAEDPQFYAVVDLEREGGEQSAVGVASYLRIMPEVGSIEVGHIRYSPLLQRTRAATEAMHLMMCRAFDELGYRRYEWKCDALNAPSRRAAERLGFTYEGTFRQATIYKGRNRDTAWYSIIDAEWPTVRAALDLWLDPSNFDASGTQRARLRDLREGFQPGSASDASAPTST